MYELRLGTQIRIKSNSHIVRSYQIIICWFLFYCVKWSLIDVCVCVCGYKCFSKGSKLLGFVANGPNFVFSLRLAVVKPLQNRKLDALCYLEKRTAQ